MDNKEKARLVKIFLSENPPGRNRYAVFEIVDGQPVLRAASESRASMAHLQSDRILADLLERRVFILSEIAAD